MWQALCLNLSPLLKLQCSSETDNKQLQISTGKGVSDKRENGLLENWKFSRQEIFVRTKFLQNHMQIFKNI